MKKLSRKGEFFAWDRETKKEVRAAGDQPLPRECHFA